MAVRGGFVLVISLVFLSFNAKNFVVSTLTHDQKVDMISEAYMSLKSVVESLLDVHTTIQAGDGDAESDISELQDSKTRSEYEVAVMDIEHQLMLAEAAKRSDVTAEEQKDADERGEAIEEAQKEVEKLGTTIVETQTKMNDLNAQMKTSTLSADSLNDLLDQANLEVEDPDDHITMPSTADIKTKVDEQLVNVQTVIDTVSDSTVQQEAGELKTSISTKFAVVLDDTSGQTVSQLTVTLKQIDIDLLHLRDLDIYGSAARMEL